MDTSWTLHSCVNLCAALDVAGEFISVSTDEQLRKAYLLEQ